MLKRNCLLEKIRSGKTVIGTFLIIPSVVSADIISSSGLDFIIIDSEHGPINFETAQAMVTACEANMASPIVRVSGVNESQIQKALDIGGHGLHIPNITSINQINNAIQFAKYPPIGTRGYSPFTKAGGYGNAKNTDLADVNKNSVIIVHIENLQAVHEIDKIVKIVEIDVLFLGLYDLSKSLGIPGDIENERLSGIIKKIIRIGNSYGKTIGTIVMNKQQIKKSIQLGIKYLAYSVDCEVLKNSYREVVKELICYK
jgi:2-keto-3-deoxy-L-rhamnonate aldolase RhmA